MRIFAAVKHTTLMITSRECISKIIPYKDEIMSKYEVRSMCIFGSVARSENWPRWNSCLRIKEST